MARRIGILGGTFDPVHRGHLAIAERAMVEAQLSEVVFIPAGRPRLKPEEPSASPRQRLEMLRIATAGNHAFLVSETECYRPGPTYTVDTLQELAQEYGDATELYFILGVDVLERFDRWREPERVLELCRFVVVSRPGYSAFDWEDFYSRYPAARERTQMVTSTAFDVSATELRVRAAQERSLAGLLPEGVEEYIKTHRLYRGGKDAVSMVERLLDLALERGAIKYGDFTLTSGKKSSYYFDARLLSLDPEGAHLISSALVPMLQAAKVEAVGGTTLGADPIVAAVALASHGAGTGIPAFIVRKEAKEHGTRQGIEGPLRPGSRVAIVDDVCTTGGSLFHAIDAAEKAGCEVVKVIAVLDRCEGGSVEMARRGYDFTSLLQATPDGRIEPTRSS